MVEIVTKQSLIERAADMWKEQYYNKKLETWGNWGKFYNGLTPEEIYQKLLGVKTEDEVKKAIGNGSWTRNICNECGLDSDIVVVLGEKPDIESSTASICPNCLRKALALVEQEIR